MAGVFASLKEGVAGAVDGVGQGAIAVGGGLKSGLDASLEGTKTAATKVGDVSKGAAEATLKALSGGAPFQAVFSSMEPAQLQLKVSGAGHNIELTVPESETIGGIKTAVHGATGLHPSYQRLLVRGKALDDDSNSLATAGIGDRTKLMLMHSRDRQRDK